VAAVTSVVAAAGAAAGAGWPRAADPLDRISPTANMEIAIFISILSIMADGSQVSPLPLRPSPGASPPRADGAAFKGYEHLRIPAMTSRNTSRARRQLLAAHPRPAETPGYGRKRPTPEW
jgi:hypothetical protein